LYQVSNLSRVRRKKSGRVLSPFSAKGYLAVVLWSGGIQHGFTIHRLMAQVFIPNPNNYPQINHKDENPLNNSIDNLEWCTAKYNMNYGTRTQRAAEKTSTPVVQKTKNGEEIKTYKSQAQAGRETGVLGSHISQCVNGKRKSTGGFIWERSILGEKV